jgi:hypothetical protein
MRRLAGLMALATLFLLTPLPSYALEFTAVLTGPAESPPNASPGTGSADVIIDPLAHTMHVDVVFSGLTGTTTASHIHCCTAVPGTGTAGVATMVPTFVGFPLGVTSGTYDNTFDMTLSSSYNPSFIAANGGTPASAEVVLDAGIIADEAYLNIHSTAFPGGEIRGFLTPAAVPEPATFGLLALGITTLGVGLRRRRA